MSSDVIASSIKAERLQTRAATSSEYIDELSERMAAGDTFPPVTVFTDGKDSWLADGIHRLDAAIKAKKKIGVDQRKGTRADAVEFACGANASHGLRRTNADKRRSVKLALTAFPERSSRMIADLCGVGHQLVDDLRQVDDSATCNKNTEKTRVGRDGKRQPVAKAEPARAVAEPPAELESAIEESRDWGDGDSLDDVQADMKEMSRRCKELNLFARKVLRCEKVDGEEQVLRPYCSEFSPLTLMHPLLHITRVIKNDMPVGGTAKKPILYHEQKAKELAK